MDKNLMQDQVAVITGAASGLGLAISKKLIENGVKLALVDISKITTMQNIINRMFLKRKK